MWIHQLTNGVFWCWVELLDYGSSFVGVSVGLLMEFGDVLV